MKLSNDLNFYLKLKCNLSLYNIIFVKLLFKIKSFATKSIWRVIEGPCVWFDVVIQKYIYSLIVLNWIRKPSKNVRNMSNIWKPAINAFHVIGDRLIWQVGRGTMGHLGVGPWVGSGMGHILPHSIIQKLKELDIHTLKDIKAFNCCER